MMNFFFTALVAAASISSTYAAPTIEQRDVWDPTITYPHAGTVWHAGSTHNVTWETTDAPKQITNSIGQIYLRADFDAPNQFTPILLGKGFNIRQGRFQVTLPTDLKTRHDYVINLFGDSGDVSQRFTVIRYNQ